MNQQSRARARSHRMYRRSQITAVLVGAVMLVAPSVAHGATVNAVAKAVSRTSSAPLVTALPSCPSSTFCAFQDANYKGTRWNYAYNDRPHNTWFYLGDAANDKISSFYNHRAWATYMDKNCPADSNHSTYYSGGGSESNLTVLQWAIDGSPINDSLSALAFDTNNNNPPPYPSHGGC